MNFQKIVAAVMSCVIGLYPVAASASPQYFFRYRTELVQSKPPVETPEEPDYGIGNDIHAYYVAPVGIEFTKKIPVATKDVVEWRKDSGDAPAGIDLDVSSGVFSGVPTTEGVETALFHGYDAGGNPIAKAEIQFTVFEPVGVPALVDFFTHTGTYFFGGIPNPDGVTVYRWEPIVAYPDGMSVMDSAFQGTPTSAGTYGLAWRGYDFMDREVAYAYGDFLVENGPVVEELLADGTVRDRIQGQIADKSRNESFALRPTVQRALGPVTYKLVPDSARPSGLTFSSATGRLGGVFDDFDTSASFRIEARDSYDGTTGLSNAFKLTTLPAVIDLANIPNQSRTVGDDYYLKLSAKNVVSGAEWALLAGQLPAGIKLNKGTGELSGKTEKTETQQGIVIGVSGQGMIPDQSNPFQFRVYPEPVVASTERLDVRRDTPFKTAGVTVSKGGSEGYSITTEQSIPDGVGFDTDTGVMTAASGLAAAGTYDRYLHVVVDGNWRGAVWQVLRVYDPLSVSYPSFEVTRRQTKAVSPTIPADGVIGTAKYTIRDLDGDPVPTWLSFSPASGRISVTPTDKSTADVTFGPYEVKLSDDKDSVSSAPFTIKVNDAPPIETTPVIRDIQRFITNGFFLGSVKNHFGAVTYSLVSRGNLPSTMIFRGDGLLTGMTTDPVGTVYSGLVLRATDSEGSYDDSDPFSLTVVEPDKLGGLWGLLDKTLVWTAGQPFASTLPALSNGYGTINYAFSAPVPGVVITDPATGAFSGVVATAGKATYTYTIDDDTDRAPAAGTLTLDIREPLKLAADPSYELHRAASFGPQAIPTATGGVPPYTFDPPKGVLPPGISFSNGRFFGTPTAEGAFPVEMTATDKTGASSTINFTFAVGAPLPFSVSYDAAPLFYGMTAPNGLLKAPTIANALGGNAAVTWSPAVGALPPGVTFATTGAFAGRFIGTPTATGRWNGIVINATDGEGRASPPATVDLVVSRWGAIGFGDQTIRHRKGQTFTGTLTADNAVDPMTYASTDPSGMPYDLVLNGMAGTITGRFEDEGSYPAGVTVTDDMGRQASAILTFEIVGDLAIEAGDIALKQYEEAPSSTPQVTNGLGALTYALDSGTLPHGVTVDPTTGALTGMPDTTGTFPGIVIEGTDTDGQKASTAPFAVTVAPRERLMLSAPADAVVKQYGAVSGSASVSNPLPDATMVSYFVSPALPAGITLDSKTGTLSGSSVSVLPRTTYTVTATDGTFDQFGDANGRSEEKTFAIEIQSRDQLVLTPPSDVAVKTNAPITGKATVTGAASVTGVPSDEAPVSYAVSPSLPDGVKLDPSTGVLSGSSGSILPETVYTVTATDDTGDALGKDSKTFKLEIADRDKLALTVPADISLQRYQSVPAGTAASVQNALPDGASVTFSVSPALPVGITLDPTTGLLSGMSEAISPSTLYTVTATDGIGGSFGTDRKTFSLEVKERDQLAVTPPANVTVKRYERVSGAATSTGAASVDGISPALVTYAVDPALPEGIALDPATGLLSGVSSTSSPLATYTVTATDDTFTQRGDALGKDSKTFTLEVLDREPLTLTAPTDISVKRYQSVSGNAVVNGTASVDGVSPAPVTYSVTPELPDGIVLDRATGDISGWSDALSSQTEYTITATDDTFDRLGDTDGKDLKSFRLEVTERDPLTLPAPAPLAVTQYESVAETIQAGGVAAVPGSAVSVKYTISPDLPAGFTLDPSSGALSGSSKAIFPATTFTVTATDGTFEEFGDPLGKTSTSLTLGVAERARLAVSAPENVVAKQYEAVTGAATATGAMSASGGEVSPALVTYSIEPALPEGITLDPHTGILSGTSDTVTPATTYTVTATDGTFEELGDLNGRSDPKTFTLEIKERDPLTVTGPDSYAFAQYFPGSVTLTPENVLGTAIWAVPSDLPQGLTATVNADGTLTIGGSVDEKMTAQPLEFSVNDDHGPASAPFVLTLSVGDRLPLAITTGRKQSAMLGHAYSLTLAADNIVGGTVTWDHVSGDLPAGIDFDASTGTFTGTPTEFGIVSSVTIRATDGFNGSDERTFTFAILQDGTPIGLTASGATTRVGQPFDVALPVATNVVGDAVWTIDAGATGISIDRKTGKLSGTPTTAFTLPATVMVSDQTGRSQAATVTLVSLPAMSITVPDPIAMTYNYEVDPANKAVTTDNVGAVTWTYTGTLPSGIDFDASTGAFTGTPKQTGTFGPIKLTAADSMPGTASKSITINVAMNGDPISLDVADFSTKIGYSVQTSAPTYANELGAVTFFSTDLAGTGLAIDPATGIISGTANALMDKYVNVSIRDSGTQRVTSKPLRLQVIPLMRITVPAQIMVSALTDIAPVSPMRTFVLGDAVWNDIDETAHKLPEGIVFDEATGAFKGNAVEIGTFGPFTVSSTDSIGDTGVSNSFVIKVNPGAFFIGLAKSDLPQAVKRTQSYSFDFKTLMTNVGMDESEIMWSLGAGSPPGLTLENGILSGTPTLSGVYTFDVIAKYDTVVAKRTYVLTVALPQATLVLADSALPDAKRRLATVDNTYAFDFKTLLTATNIPADDVIYAVETFAAGESLPSGLSLADGVLTGLADAEPGTFSFRVTAEFKDATDEDVKVTTAYTLNLIDEIGFAFNDEAVAAPTKRMAYSFDLADLIETSSLKGITTSDLAWSWSIDPNRAPTSMGSLPAGLSLVGSVVSGTPSNSGTYDVVVKASFDGREKTKTYRIVIGLPSIDLQLAASPLPDAKRRLATVDNTYTFDFRTLLTMKNIPVEKVSFSLEPFAAGEAIPSGLSFIDGVLSGVADEAPNTFSFRVTAEFKDSTDEDVKITTDYTLNLIDEIGFAFNDQNMPAPTKRLAYSLDLSSLIDPAALKGVAATDLTWSWIADPATPGASLPPGLSLDGGMMSGTPTLSGTYAVELTAAYDGRSLSKAYTLQVGLQQIGLALAQSSLPDAKRRVTGVDNSYAFDFKTVLTATNIPAGDVTFKVEPLAAGEAVPAGLSLVGGVLAGTADDAPKTYSFRITASYLNATDENVSTTTAYTLKLVDPIGFDFNVTTALTAGKKRLPYSFDLGALVNDSTITGFTKNQIAWSWALDPTSPMTTLPAGLSISGTSVTGSPGNSGTYKLILTASVDGRVKSKTVTLSIGLQTIGLVLSTQNPPAGDWKSAYSFDFRNLLTATNIPVSEVVFSSESNVTPGTGETAGLPPGTTFTNGVLSGTLQTMGSFRIRVKANWSNQAATAESASASQEYVIVSKGPDYRFKSVSLGGTVTCGATTVGAANCWGETERFYSEVPTVVGGYTSGGSQANAGDYSTCVQTDNNAVACWGVNPDAGGIPAGQIGNPAGLGSGVKQLEGIARSRCVLKQDGTVWCWGVNTTGIFGAANPSSNSTPVQVPGVSGATKLSLGAGAACVVINDGTVTCWGANSYGQLGSGSASTTSAPVKMVGVTNAVDVATSGSHTCILNSAGSVKCVGQGRAGQLGLGVSDSTTLLQVSGFSSGVKSISAGGNTSCAVTNGGSVKCWGSNTYGQLGDGTVGVPKQIPTQVSGLATGAASVSVGPDHTCAIMTDAATWCWGNNQSHMLGNPNFGASVSSVPVRVGGG